MTTDQPSLGALIDGRFRVAQLLEGGAGSDLRLASNLKGDGVVLVHDEMLDIDVVLKWCGDSSRSPQFRERVRRLRRITHPNVVRTFDLGLVDGTTYVTMEFVVGTNLGFELSRLGRMHAGLVPDMALDIAIATGAIHQAGLVADLQPHHIILADDGRIVLTGFSDRMMTEADAAAVDTVQRLGDLLLSMTDAARSHAVSGDDPRLAAIRHVAQQAQGGELITLEAVLRQLRALPLQEKPDAPVSRTSRPPGPSPLVAVQPFRFTGPDDLAFLGSAVPEALADVLSTARGLRVVAFVSTEEQGPTEVAATFDMTGCSHVVIGECVCDSESFKLRVELRGRAEKPVSVMNFEGSLNNVFEFQETITQHIGEALRVELDVVAGGTVLVAVAEKYHRARKVLDSDGYVNAPEVIALLEDCIDLAPSFRPAIALHAIASVRWWWTSGLLNVGETNSLQEPAEASIARALELAPNHPDTFLASGIFHLQMGDLGLAKNAFDRALVIAPTLPQALRYRAQIDIDQDMVEQGLKRFRAALVSSPTMGGTWANLVRAALLLGDRELFDEALGELEHSEIAALGTWLVAAYRGGLWFDDDELLRAVEATCVDSPAQPAGQMLALVRFARGAGEPPDVLAAARGRSSNSSVHRFLGQLVAETYAKKAMREPTIKLIQTLVDIGLTDLAWLRRCPLFDFIRDDDRFQAAERVLARRVLRLPMKPTPGH